MKVAITTRTITAEIKVPLPVLGKKVTHLSYLEVTLSDADGHSSVLPLNFLPGLHHSEIKSTERFLKDYFRQHDLHFQSPQLSRQTFGFSKQDTDHLTGERLFHLETLLFNHWLTKSKIKIPEVLLNGLTTISQAKNSAEAHSLKLKISPQDPIDLILATMTDLKSIHPDQRFRLDGNRQFELFQFADLINRMDQIAPDLRTAIDYAEEPLKEFSGHSVLTRQLTIPVALDESFAAFFSAGKLDIIDQYIWIIKPSLFGLSPVFHLLESCPYHRSVISSSFEHPLQMPCLSYLAGTMRPLEYHGLTAASV